MRIAQLAPLTESVPPTGYGGTELVVSLLTEELVARGHEVTLFASGDSHTSAQLESVISQALRNEQSIPQRRWQAYDICSLLRLKELSTDFDIVHNHMGYQALPFLSELGLPFITTNHNPVKPYNAPIYEAYGKHNFVAISNAYRRLNLPDKLNYVATIYNGIDVASFSFADQNAQSYLLFLGRMCADKGSDTAIQIARRLRLPLKLAGKVDLDDQSFFHEKVEPLLTGTDIEYVGEVDHKEKCHLFKGAIATVYPITFDEPFGLVMVESLACGTPVMAFDRGSVQEVLSDGQTAIIGKSAEDLVNRFGELKQLSRKDCGMRASQLFGKERMAQEYESLYLKILSRSESRV